MALMLAAGCGKGPVMEDDGSSLPENCLMMGETTIKGKINGYFPSLTEDRRVMVAVGNPLDSHSTFLMAEHNSDGEFEIRVPLSMKHQTVRIEYLSLRKKMMVSIDSTQIVDFDIWAGTFFHEESAVRFAGANALFNNGLSRLDNKYKSMLYFHDYIPGNRAEMDFETYRNYIDSVCNSDLDRIEKSEVPNIVREWARINIVGMRMSWFCNINSYPSPNSGENGPIEGPIENAGKAIDCLKQMPATDNSILYFQNLNRINLWMLASKIDTAETFYEARNQMVDEIFGQKHKLLCQFSRFNYIRRVEYENQDSAMEMLRNMENPFFAEYREWMETIAQKQREQIQISYACHKPQHSSGDSLIVELIKPHLGKPTVMFIYENRGHYSPVFEAEDFDGVKVSEEESKFMEQGIDFIYVTSRRSPKDGTKNIREELKGDYIVIENKDFNHLEDKFKTQLSNTTLLFNAQGEVVDQFSNYVFMYKTMRDAIEGLIIKN